MGGGASLCVSEFFSHPHQVLAAPGVSPSPPSHLLEPAWWLRVGVGGEDLNTGLFKSPSSQSVVHILLGDGACSGWWTSRVFMVVC